MDDQLFQQLLTKVSSGPAAAQAAPAPSGGGGGAFSQALSGQPSPAPAAPQAPASSPDPGGQTIDHAPGDPTSGGMFPPGWTPGMAPQAPGPDAGAQDPTRPLLDAPVAGAVESVFQTKDFLTGETPPDQRSDFRKAAEQQRPEDGAAYGLSKGVAEFGVGLLGAGKLLKAAEGVKAGATALESAKAASVGAIAFDPHTERLSNLIQSSPALSNPVSQYLAAKPDDSAAAGRLKNAFESLGMDAALVGVLGATVKGYKALSAYKQGTGSAEEAIKASEGIGQAMDDHNAIKAQQEQAQPSGVETPGPDVVGHEADGTTDLGEVVVPKRPNPEGAAPLSGEVQVGRADTISSPSAPNQLDTGADYSADPVHLADIKSRFPSVLDTMAEGKLTGDYADEMEEKARVQESADSASGDEKRLDGYGYPDEALKDFWSDVGTKLRDIEGAPQDELAHEFRQSLRGLPKSGDWDHATAQEKVSLIGAQKALEEFAKQGVSEKDALRMAAQAGVGRDGKAVEELFRSDYQRFLDLKAPPRSSPRRPRCRHLRPTRT